MNPLNLDLADQQPAAVDQAPMLQAVNPLPDVLPQTVVSGAGAKIITPEDAEQMNVENALLHGTLYLTAQALKHYRAAPHVKTDDPETLSLTVPATLPARADDALARADAMLRNQRGRQV